MMRTMATASVLLAVSAVWGQKPPSLHLFVPCGMIVPFTHIKMGYEKEQKVRLDITFDNGVMLVRRIREKGERPDILVAPGELEIRQMVQEGFIDPASVVTFGTFRMILVVPARNRAGIKGLQDLTKPSVRRIVIADPELNSVGYYAREALKGVGLWDKVKEKIVVHWHAQEAVNYICMGRVDAGVYYASCPFDSAPEKVMSPTYKVLETFPLSSHPPIKVQAGILKTSKKKELAKKFLQYLLSRSTQQTLARLGIPNFRSANGRSVASVDKR